MEHRGNLEDVRKRANSFLRDLLEESTSKSSEEVAHRITQLAFEDGNPVRNLFLSAFSNAQAPPTDPPRSLKPRNSILRLARREKQASIPDSKVPLSGQQVFNPQNIGASSSSKDRSEENSSATKTLFPGTQRSGNEGAAVPFNCIMCHEDMSSKGVCKRHLDEQHVSPKIFKCERCGEDFATKAEAKKHCNRCGLGVFTWTVVKPRPKKIYASEFTEEWFSSKSTYLEHLLKLSKTALNRPEANIQNKLRALLSHPSLRHLVDGISERLYGSATAWRNMQWPEEQLLKAIEELEDAVIVYENGMIEFGGDGTQNSLNICLFLQNLLCAGATSRSIHSAPAPQDTATSAHGQHRAASIASTLSQLTNTTISDASCIPQGPSEDTYPPEPDVSPMIASGDGGEGAPYVSHDMKVKRHLSDDSRFYEPSREPPGPQRSEPLHPPMQFQYPFDLQKDDMQGVQIPDVAPTILPYRSHEGSININTVAPGSMAQIHANASHDLVNLPPSAAASETTLVPSYQEPELLESTPVNYSFWAAGQPLNFVSNFENSGKLALPYSSYPCPSEESMRTLSIATDQTCVAMNEGDQKLENYLPLSTYPTTGFGSMMPNMENPQQF